MMLAGKQHIDITSKGLGEQQLVSEEDPERAFVNKGYSKIRKVG